MFDHRFSVGSHTDEPTIEVLQNRAKSSVEVKWQPIHSPLMEPESYEISYPGTLKSVDTKTTNLRIPITADNQKSSKHDGIFVLKIEMTYLNKLSNKRAKAVREVLIKTDASYPELSNQEETLLIKILHKKATYLAKIDTIRQEIISNQKEITATEQALGLSLSQVQCNSKQQQFVNIIKLFSKAPEKSLIKLIEANYIPSNDVRDIVKFLYSSKHDPELSKVAIGELLGNPANISLLYEYVQCFEQDFSDKTILQALRIFLDKFRLPGEGQKIDRIIQAFSELYCKLNSEFLELQTASHSPVKFSPDIVHILSYAIIMLNTDSHNPSVKRKMTEDQFLRIVLKNENGFEWKKEFLQHIYRDIQATEIKIRDVGSIETHFANPKAKVFEEPDIEGWLLVLQTEKTIFQKPKWEKKYCCISKKMLCYVDNLSDDEPRGIIPLQNMRVIGLPDDEQKKIINSFQIEAFEGSYLKRSVWNFSKGAHEWSNDSNKINMVKFSARNSKEQQNWITMINECLGVDPLYDQLLKNQQNRKVSKDSL